MPQAPRRADTPVGVALATALALTIGGGDDVVLIDTATFTYTTWDDPNG